jgi:hypothetical protein
LIKNAYPYNPKERNKIVFKENVIEVQDSLLAFESILNKMPVYKDDLVQIRVFDKNVLYVNFKRISNIDSLLAIIKNNKDYSIKELEPLSNMEQKRFLHLVIFLKNNYLYDCEYFKVTNFLECLYRESGHLGDYYDDLLRFVSFSNSSKSFDSNIYKILDKKENLILYAEKEAKIWEGENK